MMSPRSQATLYPANQRAGGTFRITWITPASRVVVGFNPLF
jgi:hypothetical protein